MRPTPAAAAADIRVTETLLRCWVRENGIAVDRHGGPLRIGLPASGLALEVPVHYRSPCGWHRFGPPVISGPAPEGPSREAPVAGGPAPGGPVAGGPAPGGQVAGGPAPGGPVAGGQPVDAGLLAALLVREIASRQGLPASAGADCLGRVIDSLRRIAVHIEARATTHRAPATPGTPTAPPGPAAPSGPAVLPAVPLTPAAAAAAAEAAMPFGAGASAVADRAGDAAGLPLFLVAEQALITGHPFHPTAKSREGASPEELATYSPELHGSFALHWFAAHPSVAASGGTIAGRGPAELLRRLLPDRDLPAAPAGHLLLPAHPWQARHLRARPDVTAMIADGLLVDLGPAGPPWYPTASLRTVWRPDAPVMIKLSLGMRITNSRRVNLRGELELSAQVSALLDAGPRDWLASAHPGFHLLEDPAWVGLNPPGAGSPAPGAAGAPGPGLDSAIRVNPFGADDRVVCVAGLVADRPDRAVRTGPANPADPGPSMLARIIDGLAARAGRPAAEIAADWFARYLRVVAAPALDLYARHGVGLEAHQQNCLVTLDDHGWPTAGWYRDSQGYYVAASHADAARRAVPGFGDGLAAIFDNALVDERVLYYLMINNVFGLAGALGAANRADEAHLLAAVRALLVRARADLAADGVAVPGLFGLLLSSPVLRCKANFATAVDGRDELAGPVATQSLYVDIPNPLVTELGS
ncbi:IucA/IucC family protein [Frankia sp. CiP1_Cm_nod1]|uniref:IucA/IucC family protein n=1 Tax=Frankia sp. CiP1_Cm_nod1 TaxID=2897160 RepID=UPI00404500BB